MMDTPFTDNTSIGINSNSISSNVNNNTTSMDNDTLSNIDSTISSNSSNSKSNGGIPDIVMEKWRKDFDNLVLTTQGTEDVVDMDSALYGLPLSSTVRGLFWKVSLGCLSKESRTKWVEQTRKQRNKYDTLKRVYIVDPRTKNEVVVDDPLSQNKDSIWNQFFENETTQKEIGHDISRTYPDLEFFEGKEIQDAMTRILFIYSKQYPKIKYLQGMNEILAPVLFSMYADSHWGDFRYIFRSGGINNSNSADINTDDGASPINYPKQPIPYYQHNGENNSNEEYNILRDARYYEHDAYFVFDSLMSMIGKWFTSPSTAGPLPPPRLSDRHRRELYDLSEREANDAAANIVVVEQCHSIFTRLGLVDSHLYEYLKNLNIEPHLYQLRWVRIMLAQIFPLSSLLVLWDTIFRTGLDLLDYIIISMMLTIKDFIIGRDYSECMQVLFNYPITCDTSSLLFMSYSIKEKVTLLLEEANGEKINLDISSGNNNGGKRVIKPPPTSSNSNSHYTYINQPVVDNPNKSARVKSDVTIPVSSQPLPSQHQHNQQHQKEQREQYVQQQQQYQKYQQQQQQQQQRQKQQQHQNQQQQQEGGFSSLFTSFTSTVKQMLNDINEMEPSKEIERLKENQLHVSNRIDRIMYTLDTLKTPDNTDIMQSIQDELTVMKRMLNPQSNTAPPIVQSNKQKITQQNEIISNHLNHKQMEQQKLIEQQQQQQQPPILPPAPLPPLQMQSSPVEKLQPLQHFSVPQIPIYEEDLVEVYSESLKGANASHLEEDVTEEELNFMNRLNNNLGF